MNLILFVRLVLVENVASEWTVKRREPASFIHESLSPKRCALSLSAHLK